MFLTTMSKCQRNKTSKSISSTVSRVKISRMVHHIDNANSAVAIEICLSSCHGRLKKFLTNLFCQSGVRTGLLEMMITKFSRVTLTAKKKL